MINKNSTTSLIYIVCLLISVLFINYITMRHYTTFDLTQKKLFSLDNKSKTIVSDLKEELWIYVYFKPEHELIPMIKKLMTAYQSYSNQIIVKWIDPYRDFEVLNSLGNLKEQFKLNSILLKHKVSHKFLTINDVASYDRSLEQYGIQPKLRNFTGESAITASIISLLDTTSGNIGLIANHGERDPNDINDAGISNFIKSLLLQGFKISLIDLRKVNEIPKDLKILIDCMPRINYTEQELLSVISWMKHNQGSLFLALDPLVSSKDNKMLEFNINPLLEKYGIQLENTIVIDPDKQIPFSRPDNLYIDSYSDFPIVKDMKNIPALFFQARSLTIKKNEDCFTVPLAATSEKGWGENNYSVSNYTFEEQTDSKGPVYIGVAAMNKSDHSKLIVFGDSDFMANVQYKNPGNDRLLENCFYWLSDKSKLLDIPSKEIKGITLNLGRWQLIYILLLGVVIPPVSIILLGICIWRKRK